MEERREVDVVESGAREVGGREREADVVNWTSEENRDKDL